MRPGTALRRALADLIGQPVEELITIERREDWTYQRMLDTFGSNAGIADAAGFRTGPPSSARWRDRRSFMRNLQRYALGRSPKPAGLDFLTGVVKEEQVKRSTPRDIDQVLAFIGRLGVTVPGFAGWVAVSKDYRFRYVPNVVLSVELLEEMGFFEPAYAHEWAEASDAFGNAWGESYGIGFVVVDDVEELTLKIGEHGG